MNAIEQIFGSTTPPPVTKGSNELGQEDFLKLLVAQLKNQDPNNPADNGEFLGQIAQFSMVDGIDGLNTSFDGVAGSLYSTQAIQAAALVGTQVLTETDTAHYSTGNPIEGIVNLNDPAGNLQLRVYDSAGGLVKTIELGDAAEGSYKFSWDGVDDAENKIATGDYIVKAQGLINGQSEAIPLQLYSTVESVSVDRNNASILLHLSGEKSIGISQVNEYR